MTEIPLTEIQMEERPFDLGRFSVVHKAKWCLKDVVVKVIRTLDENEYQNFMKEAEFTFRLNHQNIIDLFGITRVKRNQFAIVMEMAEHGSLDRWIGKLERGQEIKIAMCVVNGLQYVHSQKVMHRDIKPKNILMCGPKDDMIPKIADFGSAKISERVTRNTKIGDDHYVAPEITQFCPYSFKADVFSLAMTMFELFNEKLIQASPEDVKRFVLSYGEIAKLPESCNVPLCLRNLILRGLNRNPDTRPTLPDYFHGKNAFSLTELTAYFSNITAAQFSGKQNW